MPRTGDSVRGLTALRQGNRKELAIPLMDNPQTGPLRFYSGGEIESGRGRRQAVGSMVLWVAVLLGACLFFYFV